MLRWNPATLPLLLAIPLAAVTGLWLAGQNPPPHRALPAMDAPQIMPVEPEPELEALIPSAEPPDAPELPSGPPPEFAALKAEWAKASTLQEQMKCADALATLSTVESVSFLLQAINNTRDWKARNELATSLRSLAEPEALNAVLPALLGPFDRGSRVFSEMCDAIARMAQADTVVTLEALHWQSCTQPGQSMKIVRAIAGIRNEPAKRELMRLSSRSDNEALVAAANAALEKLHTPPPSRLARN